MIDIIEKKLDEVQKRKLLQSLGISLEEEDFMFSQNLQNIPWTKIKLELELLERSDVVNMVQKNTLITKGNDRKK